MSEAFVPRDWQIDFAREYQEKRKRNFLVEACTSAGKTGGALYIYESLKQAFSWRFLVVVVPAEHLMRQYAKDAKTLFGIKLFYSGTVKSLGRLPTPEELLREGYQGLAISYQWLTTAVDKIPGFIKEIIDNKLWECLFVAKGVVTPYYCRYVKGTDSENFRAFITAKRPNGLETSVDTIERVLQADPEAQRQFRAIIYESRQGERTDLIDETSYGDRKKLDLELSQTQRSVIRAANRAAEAIPVIGELLDRGLIAIDVAAQLGRDIKDPNNLTAEEREYVDKRDLIGLRINKYIYTNQIPEDEDREPAYSRQLNWHVKDLLGTKDRSKSVRMDNPKKAAEKLLTFYQGDRLKELIDYLRQALEPLTALSEPAKEQPNRSYELLNSKNQLIAVQTKPSPDISTSPSVEVHQETPQNEDLPEDLKPTEEVVEKSASANWEDWKLTPDELAKRLKIKPRTILNMLYNKPDQFSKWIKKRDPDGIVWQRSDNKKGRSWLFIPVQESQQE